MGLDSLGNKSKMNEDETTNDGLGQFITKLWGSEIACADELGISPRTIRNWKTQTPRGMLKHAPEIVAKHNITWTQLAGEIVYQEETIKK